MVQRLLKHRDVAAMMVYTHVVGVWGVGLPGWVDDLDLEATLDG